LKGFITIALTLLLVRSAAAVDYSDCFVPGEDVRYKVTWMGIPLAWSKISTERFIEDGQSLIRIRIKSKTYKAFAHIHKVDDLIDAIIDPVTALPLRVSYSIHEGSRHKSHFTTFDHVNKVAIFQDRITKDIKEVPIASDTQDLLSYIYSNRKKDLQILTEKPQRIWVDGKLYELGMKILKEGDMKLPNYGAVPSIEIEPIAAFDGLFLRQGKITFWVSKQNRRVVTCVNAKIPVGKISIKLQRTSGPGNDFWVTEKE